MNQPVFLKKKKHIYAATQSVKTDYWKKYGEPNGVFVRFLSVTCNFSFVGACTRQKSEIRCLQLPNQFTLSAAVSTPFWFCRYFFFFYSILFVNSSPAEIYPGSQNLLITSIISLYAILRAAGLQLDTGRSADDRINMNIKQ